jgi:hypothetical protein
MQNELDYRSAGGLVTSLTLFFGIYLVVSVLAAGSTWMELDLLCSVSRGTEISEAEASANDARQGLIGLGSLCLYLVLAVLFCVWIYRANRNARALGAEGMRFSPGWCVGWFFIPFMNLFKPCQAVQEIWKASNPQADAHSWAAAPGSALVGAWWGCWIIAGILGQFSFRLSTGAETLEAMTGASWVTFFAFLFDIPLTICAILVVRGIHNRQELKHLRPTGEMTFSPPESETTSWAA